jgi:anti-sigma B factor antagonist
MEISEKKVNEVNILILTGKLDTNTWPQLEGKIVPMIDSGETKFLIDCTHLDYISSAGLRVLLMAAKKLKNKSGKIVIASLKDHIKEVFDIAGFSTIFPITTTVDEGISSF